MTCHCLFTGDLLNTSKMSLNIKSNMAFLSRVFVIHKGDNSCRFYCTITFCMLKRLKKFKIEFPNSLV